LKLKSFFENLGPGPIVAAAFIGPGTVTVCTLAGVNFGFGLIWALLLSVVATVVLQEISGRIGLVTGMDLAQLIRNQKQNQQQEYLVHQEWKLNCHNDRHRQ
jgi:NRAMP (natural resistance-associated macrophage protein)-like metal ion transporter